MSVLRHRAINPGSSAEALEALEVPEACESLEGLEAIATGWFMQTSQFNPRQWLDIDFGGQFLIGQYRQFI